MLDFEQYCTEQDAIRTFGIQSQVIVAIEELSELQKELTKFLRGDHDIDHISEEMADVYIMLDQLCMIFSNLDSITEWKIKKLHRLAERLHRNSDGSDD